MAQPPSENDEDFNVLSRMASQIHETLLEDDNPQRKDLKDLLKRHCNAKDSLNYTGNQLVEILFY
jgi:hypothetical protein